MQESARRRIKELEVMVADTVVESPDTTTIVLFVAALAAIGVPADRITKESYG
jgi:hypothetical protein